MKFDFSDEQFALRDMSRDLFAKESPPSRLRGLWDGKPWDRTVWKTMAEAGLCGITVPETYDGAGGNEVDLALVYEEAGQAALPEPLLESTGFAAPLIADTGTEQLKERWLPAIANGDAIVAVQGPYDGHVAWGAEADAVILMIGNELHLFDREHFTATPVKSLDPSRPLARVDTQPEAETRIANYHDLAIKPGWRAVFANASLLNGNAMHLLEATVAYVKDRKQFGRPVGSFQAVKHKLASMHVALEASRPAAWYAGYAIATGAADAANASSVAKLAAMDCEALCNQEALQCHGGIGFTWEHDLHLWLKRGIALRSIYGSYSDHRRAIVNYVLRGDFTDA